MRLSTRIAKSIFFIVALTVVAFKANSQDLHFAQYYTQASTLNPALVGNYDGSFRVAAIFRNQWQSALGKEGYQTIGADADFCLLEGYLKTDKLAIGVGFFNDRSGAAGYSVLNANLSVAYHKGFGKKGQHRLSTGLQGGFIQNRIESPTFADQFQGHNESPALSSAENFQRGIYKFDFNAGLYWRSNFNDRLKLGLGLGAYHLITPTISTVVSQVTRAYDNNDVYTRKFNADINLEAFIGKQKKVSITPEFLYLNQKPFAEYLPGLSATYYFSSGFRNNNSVSLGLRFRSGGNTPDAVVPMANVEFRNVRLGFAYDVNVSPLKTSTNYRGAFELSLAYVGETIKSFKANKSLPSRRF